MSNDDAILDQAAAWHTAGRQVALATVIATWGSSPRPVGSLMAVDESGAMVGSVSGGCLDGAVVVEALRTLADGEVRRLRFDVADEAAGTLGLACGGRMEIYIEPVE